MTFTKHLQANFFRVCLFFKNLFQIDKSRGFGFVEYEEDEDAAAAIENMNGSELLSTDAIIIPVCIIIVWGNKTSFFFFLFLEVTMSSHAVKHVHMFSCTWHLAD